MSLPPIVLGYHSVLKLPRSYDPSQMAVTPKRFMSQVAWLKRRGYEVVSAGELAGRLRRGSPLEGYCALTFDDGAEDNATTLPDLLEQLDVPATLFVSEGLLGLEDPFFAEAAGVHFMGEAQLARVAQHPLIEIGSHTSHHTELASAGADEALELLTSSRRSLSAMIGTEVRVLSYPRCGYSPAAAKAAEAAGFEAAFACHPHGRWAPFEIPRVIVNRWDRRPTFAAKAGGGFQQIWDSVPGRIARRIGASLGLAPQAPPEPPSGNDLSTDRESTGQ